jgi:hypothetical protein
MQCMHNCVHCMLLCLVLTPPSHPRPTMTTRDDDEQLVFTLPHLHPRRMTTDDNNNDGPSPHPRHVPTYPTTTRRRGHCHPLCPPPSPIQMPASHHTPTITPPSLQLPRITLVCKHEWECAVHSHLCLQMRVTFFRTVLTGLGHLVLTRVSPPPFTLVIPYPWVNPSRVCLQVRKS